MSEQTVSKGILWCRFLEESFEVTDRLVVQLQYTLFWSLLFSFADHYNYLIQFPTAPPL